MEVILGLENIPKFNMAVHAATLFHHIYAIIMAETLDLSKGETTMDIGYFKYYFLSSWNFAFQIIYLTVALIYDFYVILNEVKTFSESTHNFFKKYLTFKNSFFLALIFPIAMFVCTCFWTTFYFNRELIMPIEWDSAVPKFLNNAIHVTVVYFVICEMSLVSLQVTHFSYKKFLALISVYIAYIVCIISVYLYSGKWVYPFLNNLLWSEIFLIFIATYVYLVIIFMGSFPINKYCHDILWKDLIHAE